MRHSVHSVTIKRNIKDVFVFCRQFKNFPKFIPELTNVRGVSTLKTLWVLEAGLTSIDWKTKIVQEIPLETICWKTIGNSDIEQIGSATFKKNTHGNTVLKFTVDYSIPGGVFTETVIRLLGKDPDDLIALNLQRLKNYLETKQFQKKVVNL